MNTWDFGFLDPPERKPRGDGRVTLTCKHCGREFSRFRSDIGAGYCSQSCGAFETCNWRNNRKGKAHRNGR